MEERKEEIKIALALIKRICDETNICLIAQERNGLKYVAIHDNETAKTYVILKDNEQ